ncbi:glycosyltransferase family 2 protein [Algoriphagus halophytocola]|uniref:glycosyltransferase family 2 protein n=1 Tax=Algoriphagus halophytocola TaxID=2991499 RepID=UPI0022DE7D3F|nr:glycosyltransferase family 2 protein [Algoriphagus sp. TR-M9]WBL42586.1 glycosyltransferase family 2 protein [Algoriphagus sp. TR-M9]
MSDIRVAVILLNWNGIEFTRACLNSLSKVDFRDFKVILVDNASQNPEGEALKNEFPELDLIQNSENLGFSGGNNVGIRAALDQGFSHVLLLNNDTEVEPDFLGKMTEQISSYPEVGIVQPMICFLHEKGKIWSAGGTWKQALGRAITRGDRRMISAYQPASVNLDWATGCCMLLSREAIQKAGLLNEQYFAYFEDVEWSLRIRKSGFNIQLVPAAKIYHEAGASSKKKHDEGTLSPSVFFWHVRNQFYLIRSQGSLLGFAYHLGRFILWMGYFLLRGRFKKLKAVARGMAAGLSDQLQAAPKWP